MQNSILFRSLLGTSLSLLGASVFGCDGGFATCTDEETCGPDDGGNSDSPADAGGPSIDGGSGLGGDGSGGADSPAAGGTGSGGDGSGGASGNTGGTGGSMNSGPACGEDGSECAGLPIVYVSPDGSDTEGDGSKTAPLKTIAYASKVALLGDKVMRACNTLGAYSETIEWTISESGLTLDGGFACGSFTQNEGRALFPAATPAGHSLNGAKDIILRSLEMSSPDATAPSESSYALFIVDSEDIKIEDSKLIAGKGADGTDGEPYAEAAADGVDGQDGYHQCSNELTGNRTSANSTCEVTTEPGGTKGGKGGDGERYPPTGPEVPESGYAGGEAPYNGGAGGPYRDSSNDSCVGGLGAHAVTTHAATSATLPSVSTAGYVVGKGQKGTDGKNGRGGGGGAGAYEAHGVDPVCTLGAAGGGGGSGGCGGKGGRPGTGGGASFAAYVYDSTNVSFTSVILVAASGGAGGDGGAGQAGGDGGNGGEGGDRNENIDAGNLYNWAFWACDGGNGGDGSDGTGAGGGEGGPAVGIAYHGDSPDTSDVTYELPGVAAPAGVKSGGYSLGNGAVGVIAETKQY